MDYVYSDGELYHARSHKYIKREWRNGRWRYWYKDEHGDPPAGMQTLYDFLHRKHIDRSVNVQRYLDKYTGKT